MNESKSLFIGIDPEREGAIAAIFPHNEIRLIQTPANSILRTEEINALLFSYLGPNVSRRVFIFIEKLHIFPGMNSKAMNNLIQSYGTWLGVLGAVNFYFGEEASISLVKISPKTWKAYFGLHGGKIKKGSKVDSYNLALTLFSDSPEVKRGLMVGSGITDKQVFDRAEALLLAEYGRRMF